MTHLVEFQEFLEDQALAAKTVKTYVNAIKRMPKKDPLKLFTDPKLNPNSRQTYRAALMKWAEFTEDDDLIDSLNSAATRRKLTKMRRGARTRTRYRVEPFTEDELQAVYDVLDEWDEDEETPSWVNPALKLLIKLGLRAGADLVWLERDQVREALSTGVLHIITKGETERKLPVNIVQDELTTLYAHKGWKHLAELISPYAHAAGKPDAAYQAVSRKLKAAAAEAGIDPKQVHTHRFRHTAANKLMDRCNDEFIVRDFLGHKSVETTRNYLRRDRTADIARLLED